MELSLCVHPCKIHLEKLPARCSFPQGQAYWILGRFCLTSTLPRHIHELKRDGKTGSLLSQLSGGNMLACYQG